MPQPDLINTHRMLTAYLERHEIERPRFCSEILISKALDIRRIDIYAHFDRPVSETELEGIRKLGRRLSKGEPLQLVVGDTQFLSCTFKTAPGVFIPRPETETLVETAAKHLKNIESAPLKILDLCAGTGVIAISILKFFPGATAVAVDISENASRLAAENAGLLAVEDRLTCFTGDLYSPISHEMTFHAILSNPPYIPSGDIETLSSAVKDYDPRTALDGGPDGLDMIRRIIEKAPDFLENNGLLAIETGIGQYGDALRLMSDAGFSDCDVAKDINEIERVVFGWIRKRH